MSTPFQNRLVGTVIVAAAAIIFLPDLLNGKKITHEERFAAIPAAPSTDNIGKIKKFPEQKFTKLPNEKIYDEVAQDDQLFSASSDDNTTLKIDVADKAKEFKPVTTDKTPALNEKSKLKTKTPPSKDANNNASTLKAKTKTVAKKTPAPKANVSATDELNYAWVIQLGSFREQHNVDNLINTLQKNGYAAFTKPIKTRHGKLIKVFVGPELSKASLEKQLAKLKKLTKMQGKIARFKPAQ